MAETGSTLYVPWIDWCFKGKATGLTGASKSELGGLAAVNAATGAVDWTHLLTSFDTGGATVANDVVFTSTYKGTIYALSTTNGAILWSTTTPAGINSFPAVTQNMLIIGAGAQTSAKNKPHGEIIAYSLGGQ
jgi:outer membrane protein assembly factor BamB